MTVQSLAHFNGQNLSIIDHDGRKWFTAEEVGRGFGYAHDRAKDAVLKIYERHPDEFRAKDSTTVKLTAVDGKLREMRIFSGTGIIKLGNFANTPRAKEFRNWAADVLDGQAPADSAELERVKAALLKYQRAEFDSHPRWMAIADMRQAGRSNGLIAQALGISKRTVCEEITAISRAGLGHFLPPAGHSFMGKPKALATDARQLNLGV